MLSALINSKTKRAILKQILSNPDDKFYVRELSALLDISVGTIHRELVKFENGEILKSEKRGNLRFFFANKSNPVFKELKQIIFKTEGIEGSLREIVSRYRGITLSFIYGSYAKNKEIRTSDIDLFLVGKFPINEFTGKIRSMENTVNREINFSHYSQKEFAKESSKNGSFLNIILKDKIIILKGSV